MVKTRKTSNQRLSVVDLAQALGNVSVACRKNGVSRNQFHEYKQRFQTLGLEGLKDIPPFRRSHPQTTKPEIVERILGLSLAHPGLGCIRLSELLEAQGTYVSSPTIQSILIKNGLGKKNERLMQLEDKAARESLPLTMEQTVLIEKANPCFRERHFESIRPGEILVQDAIFIGSVEGLGKVYLEAVVDTFCSYAFGFLHMGKLPDCAVAVLHYEVLPFYKDFGLPVTAIITNHSRQYCGKQGHHYELYLLLNEIEHRKAPLHQTQANGYMERFSQTIRAEFFKPGFFEKNIFENLEQLQDCFDKWLAKYNTVRPHRGYRNMGKCPHQAIADNLGEK